MTRIHIGYDASLIEEGVSADAARVYVEANNGEVSITCAWGDAWAGLKTVGEFYMQAQAESLAWDIALNPVAELTRLGYQHDGWFVQAD